jgi:hypothetical protein
MERIAPPLELVLTLRMALEGGQSVRWGLKKFSSQNSSDLSLFINSTIYSSLHTLDRPFSSHAQFKKRNDRTQTVLIVAEQGLNGDPILKALIDLQKELIEQYRDLSEKEISAMPIKSLFPLLCLQLPAIMLVIIGPLIENLVKGLQ